jgi:signal transduction histidine kinase
MPSEQMQRIFEPFFSLKSHGTGLGLAIVKRTVEAHGGKVAARANAQAGLTLAIELPLARPAGGQPALAIGPATRAGSAS